MLSAIESAQTSLLLLVYLVTAGASPLLEAVAERSRAGVRVTILVDDRDGDKRANQREHPALVLARLWPKDAPEPRLLVPDRTKWPQGNMHAKGVVADMKTGLITSANLTGWATDSNLEVGMILDEKGARELHGFILSMLRKGLLHEVPFR